MTDAAAAPDISTPAVPEPATPTKTSKLAIWSLVLGLLGILCLLGPIAGIPAIVCGAMALSRINASGGLLTGRGQAIAGLVLGIVSFVVLIVMMLVAAMLVPAVTTARTRAQEAMSMSNARQLAICCMAYAQDNDGRLPDSLDELTTADLLNGPLPSSPFATEAQGCGYVLAARGNLNKLGNEGATILLYETVSGPRGMRVVAYVDGHAESIPEDVLEERLAEQHVNGAPSP